MPTVNINNINIYYEVHGQGKPIVIINGLSLDVSETSVLVQELAKHYQVLTLDNRGAGRSDKPDKPYSIEEMARDTALVMKAAGIEKAAVIGISMGGRIALEIALSSPSLVDKLLLVSTSAKTLHRRSLRNWLVFNVIPRLTIFKGRYPQPYYAYSRQLQASRSYDCSDKLSEVHVSTLILQGKKDRISPKELAEKLHVGIKGSTLRLFKGGHLFFLVRDRQAFLSSVREFVD